jgi:hypothetical protein
MRRLEDTNSVSYNMLAGPEVFQSRYQSPGGGRSAGWSIWTICLQQLPVALVETNLGQWNGGSATWCALLTSCVKTRVNPIWMSVLFQVHSVSDAVYWLATGPPTDAPTVVPTEERTAASAAAEHTTEESLIQQSTLVVESSTLAPSTTEHTTAESTECRVILSC